MVAVVDAGGQAATLDTEHTLGSTLTAPGVYVLCVDTSVLAAGDVVELRIYGKADSTDTERLLVRATYGPIPMVEPLVQSIPIVSPHHYRATLNQTDGTGRTWPWAVYSV